MSELLMVNEGQQIGTDERLYSPTDDSETTEIQLAPYVKQVLRGKKTIGTFLVVGVILGVVIALIVPPKYTSEASLLPPSGSNSNALALASQLGALGSGGLLGGPKTPADLYAGIMKSRTVLRAVVDRFHLKDVYHVRREIDAERILSKATDIEIDLKSSIITLSVTDKNAIRARDLADGFLVALQTTNESMALTDSSQRRLFFETQLEREKEALATAEVELKKSQEQTGLILPAGQATLQFDTIAKVRAEIAARQVELASLRESSTDQNPNVIRLRSEIGDLERQLGSLDNGKASIGNVPTAQVPELALENIRRQRDVKYHETLFDILAKQYEAARLDESRSGPTIQVLDHPTVPEGKSGPSRVLIVLSSTVLTGLAGFFWVLLTENLASMRMWAAQFTKS
jgi:tyrosine-protein kinase Etk/Wzc